MSHNHRGVTANETAGPGQTGRELQKWSDEDFADEILERHRSGM